MEASVTAKICRDNGQIKRQSRNSEMEVEMEIRNPKQN
jgi:hypothetical protein